MAYLKTLLKLVAANPTMLVLVLRMLADTIEKNPQLAQEIIGEIQQAKT